MLKKDEYNNMKEALINAATIHAEASRKGDYKIANNNAKVINKIMKKAELNNDLKDSFFNAIIECDNVYAKSWVCIEAIRQNILKEKALRTLNEILVIEDKKYSLTKFGIKTFFEKVMPNL